MNHDLRTTLAAFAALALTLSSIGAIVTVPSAKAAAPTTLTMAEIA